MGKKNDKNKIESKIKECLQKGAEIYESNASLSRGYIRKARRLAMHFKIKLSRDARKKFCRGCNSFFNSGNCKIRIKKGFIAKQCLNCGKISRYKAETRIS
ncbi:MAG: hypothetical protein V1886_02785 [archaeon]